MKRVVLNTDIFGDPDDLWTLLFLMSSSAIKIEIIITSDEHNAGRAKYTQKLLKEMRREIPIYCGEDLGNTRCYFVPKEIEESNVPIKKDYVSALNKLKPGFTFLCVGPQTELAKSISVLKKKKAKIIIMGGSTKKEEHNIRYDIPSALKVLDSKINASWVPSDITLNDKIKVEPNDKLYKMVSKSNTFQAKALKENMDSFFKNLFPKHHLHDPLTASILLDKSTIKFSKRRFELNYARFFDSKKGKYTLNYGKSANYEKFLKIFTEKIKKII